MNILDMPNVVLMEIFEYLPYEEVSKLRQVAQKFDQVCQQVLNCGFNKAVRLHSISFKRIKALLPRRESERRNHCLARHADILTSIETRISMLSMTYSKYIDLSLCCFIPGRVLDEIFRILLLIQRTNKPLRPHEVLQELRDISSMAIEHFDEHIANNLKKNIPDYCRKICTSPETSRITSSPSLSAICYDTPSTSTSSWRAAPSPLGLCCESVLHRVNTLINMGPNVFLDTVRKPVATLTPALMPAESPTAPAAPSAPSAEHQGCLEARATMIYFKKLELEYKQGITKLHQMQQLQTLCLRQVQAALTLQKNNNIDLKKRFDDMDAKYRELVASIKQINSGESSSVGAASDSSEVVPISLMPGSSGGSDSSIVVLAATTKRRNEDSNDAELSSSSHKGSHETPKKPKLAN